METTILEGCRVIESKVKNGETTIPYILIPPYISLPDKLPANYFWGLKNKLEKEDVLVYKINSIDWRLEDEIHGRLIKITVVNDYPLGNRYITIGGSILYQYKPNRKTSEEI